MIEESDRPDPNDHLREVVNGILAGRIVPFLGAGANLCGVGDTAWVATHPERLPSGKELSKHIYQRFSDPANPPRDQGTFEELAKVSQYVDTVYGRGALDDVIRPLFNRPFPATPLHMFLATLPARWRQVRQLYTTDDLRKHLLIVTTNYDDVMENAFRAVEEPFHVVTYLANQDKHAFSHYSPGNEAVEITIGTANEYHGLDDDDFPIILKVHGSAEGDNFVITEDDYIDYLSFGDISLALPASLKAQLTKSSFLFLGYALHDWNLRAFLRRIWRAQQKKLYASWAVMAECSPFEQRYWRDHKVEILETDLQNYVSGLDHLFASAVAETI